MFEINWAVISITLLVGTCVLLGFYGVNRIFAAVPMEDRSFLDRPPMGFRITWPLINLLAFYVGDRLTTNYHYATQLRLTKAGVEYSVSVEQFFAGKVISGFLFAGMLALCFQILGKSSWSYVLLAGFFGFYYPEIWLKETLDKRNKAIFKALPFYLDVITLSVESGTNLLNGISQAVEKAPEGPLRVEFGRVLRDVRAGKPRQESLRALSDRIGIESIQNVVSSMIQAEKTGASLGQVLRAQSDQLRSERFLKAEKMAMEAPVKLLGPLIMFIFPTTFLVIIFVILSKAISQGVITWWPLVWAFTHP